MATACGCCNLRHFNFVRVHTVEEPEVIYEHEEEEKEEEEEEPAAKEVEVWEGSRSDSVHAFFARYHDKLPQATYMYMYPMATTVYCCTIP